MGSHRTSLVPIVAPRVKFPDQRAMRSPSALSSLSPTTRVLIRSLPWTSLRLSLCVFSLFIVPSPGWQTTLVTASLSKSQIPLSSSVKLLCERSSVFFGGCFGIQKLQHRERIPTRSLLSFPTVWRPFGNRDLRALLQVQSMSQSESDLSAKEKNAIKKEKKKQEKAIMMKLQACMKSKDVEGAMETFELLKGGDKDKCLSPHVYSIMVNLLGGNQQMKEALVMFEELKAHHGTPAESVYATMIRAATADPSSDLKLAESLLDECVEKQVELKLRVVQPLLSRLLAEHRLAGFFAVLDRILRVQPQLFSISASSSVAPVESLLVEAMEECGFALKAAEGDAAAGPSREEVAGWLELLLQHMAHNCLSVTRGSAERLRAALPMAEMVVMERSGACPHTGSQLQRLDLAADERARVRSALLDLAGTVGDDHRAKLESFCQWIQNNPKPFSAVIDAPNVAYARQNFEGGCFSYHQIDLVLQKLQAQGHRALVLLPWKYLQPVIPNHARFQPTGGGSATLSKHEVTAEEQAIVDRWEAEEVLAASPYGANDDWYWMMASVASDLSVISNDHMRDHRLFLLEPRPFLRWKSTQILRFDLEHAYEPERIAAAEIEVPQVMLSSPPVFSSEIQRIPLEDGGASWHIPIMVEGGEGEAVQPQHAEQACASTTLVANAEEEQEWLSLALHPAAGGRDAALSSGDCGSSR